MKRFPGTVTWPLLLLLATSHAAEKPQAYRPQRLPDGHVDMQGIWNNSNLTPLERPEGITQLAITPVEAKKLEAQYYFGPGGANQPDDPGRLLEKRLIEPVRGELRSSLIVDPGDGKIPWNAMHEGDTAALRSAVSSAFDNPEQRPGPERCLASTGAPPMLPSIDNNLYQFVQTPATTVIVSEMIHDARMIRMNGAHSPPALTSWLGDSIGWWEKDTLVVETKYFSPSSAARVRGRDVLLVSPQTTVIERFTRLSDNELNYAFTVTDPNYYTRPWTGESHFLRSHSRIYEYACHEGNYSLPGVLEGARANDAKGLRTTLPVH